MNSGRRGAVRRRRACSWAGADESCGDEEAIAAATVGVGGGGKGVAGLVGAGKEVAEILAVGDAATRSMIRASLSSSSGQMSGQCVKPK